MALSPLLQALQQPNLVAVAVLETAGPEDENICGALFENFY